MKQVGVSLTLFGRVGKAEVYPSKSGQAQFWDKFSRYCANCDLLIVHQDQLEQQLVGYFTKKNPKIIGNDYLVLGALEKPELRQGLPDPFPLDEMIDDFEETVSFQRALV